MSALKNSEPRPLALLAALMGIAAALSVACGGAAPVAACKPRSDDEALAAAQYLGSVDDASGTVRTASGEISECDPAAYYHVHAVDTSLLDKNHPDFQIAFDPPKPVGTLTKTSPTLELCVYIMCSAGGAKPGATTCNTESGAIAPIASPDGFTGCCRPGPGSLLPAYACDNGLSSLTSDDTADFLIHVCAVGSINAPFSLKVSF